LHDARRSGAARRRLTGGSLCLAFAFAACVGNAVYAFGEPGGVLKQWSPALVAGALTAFMLVHGRRMYQGRLLLSFATSVFLVGWVFESLSILTGFPFGSYHYTELMAPFLGHVPVFVMPAYCLMGYVAWSMARILVGRLQGGADRVLRWVCPLVAAALMVVWDLSMDPLRATVEQRWVWRGGGTHFGVPLENYLGWAFVTWMMFQAFALALPRRVDAGASTGPRRALRYRLSVPLAYASFTAEYLLNPFVAAQAGDIVLVNGSTVPLPQFYAEVAVLAASTMLPLALLAAVLAWRADAAVVGTGGNQRAWQGVR
jgi:uncharacterized membrane protein